MGKSISLNGNKSIGKIMQEFNSVYPYLTIWLYSDEAEATKASWNYIPFDKTISEVRKKKGSEITILANETVGEVENKFKNELGIFANICYRDSERKWFYSSENFNNLTLLDLNIKCSLNNCVYGEWK
jgi:hypothetical protein